MNFSPSALPNAIFAIQDLTDSQIHDPAFLEHALIPQLGLNDEALGEQPPALAPYFGTGLHLWQYPNQLARYLVWLAENAHDISSYVEIGARWGGMFILITEWLRRIGAPLQTAIAIDPLPPSPLIEQYLPARPEARYISSLSGSPEVTEAFAGVPPGIVFIDGDHFLRGAFADHLLARRRARIIVHHDIHSDPCPDTTFLWNALKEMEPEFEFTEFIDQYPSVQGGFLGIGVMRRRDG